MATNQTDTETWSIEDLVSALSEAPNKKKKIRIPKFQRTLVWKDDQKKGLIDSIKRGFPVGAILLFKTGTHDQGNEIYDLIDGLQRSSTLKKYIASPTNFYESSNISDIGSTKLDDIVDLLRSIRPEITKDQTLHEFVTWMQPLSGFEEAHGYSSYNLAKHLGAKFEIEDPTEMLYPKLVPLLSDIKNDSDVSEVKLPVLVFSGNQHDLALVFQRLNSQGTQLNKYQVFAAAWQAHPSIPITNRSIIEYIKKKYDSLIEAGYEVEGYDSSPKFFTSQFSVFEYLFGLGKLLNDRYDHLFASSREPEQEDSIGFNIVNLCLNLPFSEMAKLPTELAKLNFQKFEAAVIDSVEIVFSILKGFISLKMNKRKGALVAHSEMQIVSMIGKVFNSKYDENLALRPGWKPAIEKLRKNLPYHYLYDVIREQWKGAVDAKAFDLSRPESDRYETAISKKSWENALEDWFTMELEKKEKARVNIKSSTILFLKYLYTHLLSANEEISDKGFDIEHLVTIGKLKTIAGDAGLPMSAFPNLCLMDEGLNREKGDLTYYEYFDKQVEEGNITTDQANVDIEKIEKYSFTTREDLDFAVNDLTAENYISYLNVRFRKICRLFFESNQIAGE